MATVEIMVLPPIGNGRPQLLLNDDGIWRDLTPTPDTLDGEAFRKLVEKFLEQAMTSVSQGNAVNAKSMGFQKECRKFFSGLLPTDLQNTLSGLQDGDVLRISLHRSAEWVPWELLHDGKDYLGLRLHVVRLPLMSRTDHIRGAGLQRDVRHVHNLLGKDILGSDQLVADWRQTFAPFAANGWETQCPAVAQPLTFASWDELKGAQAADILHVTCHGGLRDDERSPYYWSLDLHGQTFQYRIAIEDLQELALSEKPLVFGNACASAGGGGSANRGGLHGLGAAFMTSGALNFIGTFAPITQQTSVRFAAEFYKNLLGAPVRTIAEALLATKQHFVAETADPSYLFYCLYGPPGIQYKPVH